MKRGSTILFLIYVVFGAYFVLTGLKIVNISQLPELVSTFDNWIKLIAGILIILGGFNFLRVNRLKWRH